MPDDAKTEQDRGARVLLIAASVVVVVAGLRAASDLLLPFMVAVFLAILCLPVVGWLEKARVPRVLAVPLSVVIMLGVLALMVLMVGTSATQFLDNENATRQKLEQKLTDGRNDVLEILDDTGIETPAWLEQKNVDVGVVMQYLRTAISSATSILSNAVLVGLTLIFLLYEASAFPSKLRAALGSRSVDEGLFKEIVGEVQSYFGMKILLSVVTGVCISAWVAACGLEFFMLWGFIAFLLNFIPNLGSIMAAIPAVLVAYVNLDLRGAAFVAVGYVVVNMVIGNVIEPRMMGQRLGLSTLVVFLSLIVWGWVWGPVGMLLSVPLTMLVKILLESTPDLRWVAVLLSSDAPKNGRPA